ncbi:MAG: insulinase family protein [Candidatus Marinimicrobia bacterium]|nr:insulinase family protein [Candidatus Neomarinimicrobiota bacterium]
MNLCYGCLHDKKIPSNWNYDSSSYRISLDYPSWYTALSEGEDSIIAISRRFYTGSAYESEYYYGITRLTMMSVLKNTTTHQSHDKILQTLNDKAISEQIIVDTDVSMFLFRFHRDHFKT